MITPWILAIAAYLLMRYWVRHLDDPKMVAYVLIWDAFALFGVLFWWKAARETWYPWSLAPAWGLWIAILLGGVWWLILCMKYARSDYTPPSPPDSHERNFVANYPLPGGRKKYEYRGKRRKRR